MAHFPKPFFKKARGLWYVEINRKQINLGPDRDEAFRQYHQLMIQPREQSVSPESLAGIIDVFLEWVQRHRAPDTYEWYRYRLQRLVSAYPDMRAMTLRPYHLEEWVDGYGFSSVNSRRNYLRTIKTCMRWAVRQGYLDKNPIAALELPNAEPRDVYVSPEEFDRLLEFVPAESLRELFITTYKTGCRPQESLIVSAEFVDLKNGRWVFPQKEAKGKEAPRIVYLNDEALELTQRLVARFPEGPLFRNSRGTPWTADSVNCAFDRIQIRMAKSLGTPTDWVTDEDVEDFVQSLRPTKMVKGVEKKKSERELRSEARRKLTNKRAKGFAPRYSLYALRHSWATNALKRDVDSLTVAILMGHKDPSMLARVYQHLSHSPEHMREQARRAAG